MDRRTFVSGAIGLAALKPRRASAAVEPALADPPLLRGTIDPNARGLVPDLPDDQSRLFQALLRDAAAADRPLVLGPGRYVVADIVLPARTRIAGVPGRTVIAFGGGDALLLAENAERIALHGLVLDGAGLPLAGHVPALVHLASVARATIDECTVTGSSKAGLGIDRSAGRVARNTIAGAAGAGLRAIESMGLAIAGNTVADCGAGIAVWRWRAGDDRTAVTGNDIARIGRGAAADPAEPPDGVNVFRAHGVTISGNRIDDCAGAGIRAFEADGIRAFDNACGHTGDGAILIADGTPDAVVTGNAVGTASGAVKSLGSR